MKKIIIVVSILTFMYAGPLLSTAYSLDLKLNVKDSECVEDGKIVVHYGIVNGFGHEFKNVTLGFKVMEGTRPVACKKVNVVVPKDADGSATNEVVINAPCSGKTYSIVSSIFYSTKGYMIDEWFSGCN